MIDINPEQRLARIIDLAWEIMFENVVSGRIVINKESSLQLHFSKIIFELGTIYNILPNEKFGIEMESNYEKKSIDIVCGFDNIKAAIELKCFMKSSNRAKDIDCYDALIDIERLQDFSTFQIKRFICLTDNKYYSENEPTGKGKSVSLKNKTIYKANIQIIPGWANEWKIKRDKPIVLKGDIQCNWINKDKWYYLKLDL